ncbi:hypothetical protein [Limnohabitans sp.]|uniref:hypothetical protein n=1 Tax=Limnohabitans sp. TaxID=1907725 RepID=UPI0038BC12A1
MKIKNIFRAAITITYCLFMYSNAQAANLEEPNECAVNTVRGQSGTIQNPQFVMANCTKQYIKKIEPYSKTVSSNILTNGKIQFGTSKYYGWGGTGLVVSAKNNSNNKLIYITILITNKNTNKEEYFRMMATDICDPFSICEFVTNYPLSDEMKKDFWVENGWDFYNATAIGR